jgi:hypothetical protein
MTTPEDADVGGAPVMWRLDDRWRDLRCEILRQRTVTFVTENGSTTVAAIDAGWLMRIPGQDSAPLDRDNTIHPLLGLAVATPCGIILVLDPVTRLRRTRRLVLVLAGAWPNWRLNAELDASAHVGRAAATDVAHPVGVCGARDCIRISRRE